MAFVDQDGYHFQPGHGSGIGGTPYVATSPQGQYGALGIDIPHWARHPDRRKQVLLVFFERRAYRNRRKAPPGTFEERMQNVTEKLKRPAKCGNLKT